jgi:hypothetical protein
VRSSGPASAFVLIVSDYMSECPIVLRPKVDLTAEPTACRVDSQTIRESW